VIDLKTIIGAEAIKIDQAMHDDIETLSPHLDPLLTEILEYGLFSGGKRVRPLLTVLCSRICSRDDPRLYELAIALEYLHVATLFHDDVIDKADSRRGRMSINQRFGTVAAILAGDFLHAHSMEIVGKHAGPLALERFTVATKGMVDGEFVQLRNARNCNQSESDYFAVVMGKTALLIGAACEIGAVFAGAKLPKMNALRQYGINLGCAFQIVDDLLDYLGDEAKTGKKVGNDLAEGKMTLPLIFAMQRASANDRQLLLTLLQDKKARSQGVSEVKALIQRYDGFIDSRKKAEEIIGQALQSLHVFSGATDQDSFDILLSLTGFVLDRER